MDKKALEDKAEDAARFLKTLASGPRLLLMCQMFDGEKNVGELAEETGMRMPTVSQQLALLRAQGLVETRREGTTIYYRLVSSSAQQIMRILYQQFCAEEPQDAQDAKAPPELVD